MTDLLKEPAVKQTLTQSDEKYWYPFAYKVEVHTCRCEQCGAEEISTLTYKIFAHYLYTEHTFAHKSVPVGAALDSRLPIHTVRIESAMPTCAHCAVPTLHFQSDKEWRAYLQKEGARRTAEARRDNELRAIFGGPPVKPKAAVVEKPKVSLTDFLKGL